MGKEQGNPNRLSARQELPLLTLPSAHESRGEGGGPPWMLRQLKPTCPRAQVRVTTHSNDDPLLSTVTALQRRRRRRRKLRVSRASYQWRHTQRKEWYPKVYKGIRSSSFALSAHTPLILMTQR